MVFRLSHTQKEVRAGGVQVEKFTSTGQGRLCLGREVHKYRSGKVELYTTTGQGRWCKGREVYKHRPGQVGFRLSSTQLQVRIWGV